MNKMVNNRRIGLPICRQGNLVYIPKLDVYGRTAGINLDLSLRVIIGDDKFVNAEIEDLEVVQWHNKNRTVKKMELGEEGD